MHRKKALLKRAVACVSLLLALLLLSSCGMLSLLFQGIGGISYTDFDTLEYERPDFEEIDAQFDKLDSLIKESSSTRTIQNNLYTLYGLINNAQTQNALAEIFYYEDVTNSFYDEEMTYCSEKIGGIQTRLNELYAAIINAGLESDLLSNWTEADFASFEKYKDLYDDEYQTLIARRTELENQYLTGTTEIQLKLGGKSYYVDEMIDAVRNGLLTYDEYLDGIQQYYRQLNEIGGPVYLELLTVDKALAKKLGVKNLTAYYYETDYTREYTPDEAQTVWQYTKEYLAPLYKQLSHIINDDETLVTAYYQANASAGNRTIEAYNDAIWAYAEEISPDMENALNAMVNYHLSSIGSSVNRQNSSYTTLLPSYIMPFMFITTLGDLSDVATFIHEFGHFYSFYRNGAEIDNILDVEEIQSQANEWLFMEKYQLSGKQKQAWMLNQLADAISTILQGCMMDEFQQYAYGRVDATDGKDGIDITVDELNKKFASLVEAYGLEEDFDIIPYETLWCEITHTFIAPFYYISYAMSAIPALEIYDISRTDRAKAIAVYNNITDETGYRTFEQVLSDNGLSSPFEKAAYEKLSQLINDMIREVTATAEKTRTVPQWRTVLFTFAA